MAKPVITSSLNPIAATLGVAIANYTITASGIPTSFDAKGLPAGLAINAATGVISWTPTAGGQANVIIVAENADGNDYAILPITVSVTSGIYNDGGIVIGAQVVTIGGQNYIFDDFNPSEESKEIDSPDQLGRPNRAAYIRQKIKGSGSLQLASAATPIPGLFATFLAVHRGQNKTFVITKVGIPQKAGEETKIPIDISEVLNP
jgi:hypothetical protein